MKIPGRTRSIALLLLVCLVFCGSLLPGQTQPPTQSPVVSQDAPAPPPETSQDCRNNYSATQCTAENTKFLGAFDLICLLAVPGTFLFALPFVIGIFGARGSWWRTSHLQRWLFPTLTGAAVVLALILFVPFLPQVAPVTPQAGLLKYLGVDPGFIDACDPCRTRVTNRSPLYGFLPTGMPRQGLAPQYPYVLGASILVALGIWGALYWLLFLFIRKWRAGLEVSR
ncbi:MAG: hypothetical protein HYR60_20315 [Acidobacteria bacterium]|nr:hypothetical protein [Acidobacteriota bacterium]